MAVQQNAPVSGSSIVSGDQFMVTEDSIQVIDLQIVSLLPLLTQHPLTMRQDNLDDGGHPFHLHGHSPWMYVYPLPHLQPNLVDGVI
jgi:hypothetical protein